jgi:hypothetical protein
MVAFVTSCLVFLVATGAVMRYGQRRPPGTPVTWGEAMVAGVVVFGLMMLGYAIIPNQWLLWADNELGWRKDAFGIPNPFGKSFFEDGITFFGRGRIIVTKEAIRDLIAVVIYGVVLGMNIALWSKWQKRGQKKERPELTTSRYGRPLVRKA